MPTSKLQARVGRILRRHLGQYTIKENLRPEWMTTKDGGRLELDFFIEELNLGIEVQGDQHYRPSSFFHENLDSFLRQQERDKEKKEICQEMGTDLVEIYNDNDLDRLLTRLTANTRTPTCHERALMGVLKASVLQLFGPDRYVWRWIEILRRESRRFNRPQRMVKYKRLLRERLASELEFTDQEFALLLRILIEEDQP